MRFHILGIPHTISVPEYTTCAFTQKVVKLCQMLTTHGHHVIHYGNEDSKVLCAENVPVVSREDLEESYPGYDWRERGWPGFSVEDQCYRAFYSNTPRELKKREQPKDILLLPFGGWHRPIANISNLMKCESGIGYPDGGYAPFRVFESYAVMHSYHTSEAIKSAQNNKWYDRVIPNAFDLDQFEFSDKKENYFLFLGRVNDGKGFHIAKQLAEGSGVPLLVAGANHDNIESSKYLQMLGVVGIDKRKELLRDAKAVICASTYLEAFCGVQVEAMLSGTPVISSDWGAFAEYNRHGVTGYRCSTFEHFVWAARNIENISPQNCRSWAEQFSIEQVGERYDEYFKSLGDILYDIGWYAANPDRTNLDFTSF